MTDSKKPEIRTFTPADGQFELLMQKLGKRTNLPASALEHLPPEKIKGYFNESVRPVRKPFLGVGIALYIAGVAAFYRDPTDSTLSAPLFAAGIFSGWIAARAEGTNRRVRNKILSDLQKLKPELFEPQ